MLGIARLMALPLIAIGTIFIGTQCNRNKLVDNNPKPAIVKEESEIKR